MTKRKKTALSGQRPEGAVHRFSFAFEGKERSYTLCSVWRRWWERSLRGVRKYSR